MILPVPLSERREDLTPVIERPKPEPGYHCSDCGERLSEREDSYCRYCGNDLCDACSSYTRNVCPDCPSDTEERTPDYWRALLEAHE